MGYSKLCSAITQLLDRFDVVSTVKASAAERPATENGVERFGPPATGTYSSARPTKRGVARVESPTARAFGRAETVQSSQSWSDAEAKKKNKGKKAIGVDHRIVGASAPAVQQQEETERERPEELRRKVWEQLVAAMKANSPRDLSLSLDKLRNALDEKLADYRAKLDVVLKTQINFILENSNDIDLQETIELLKSVQEHFDYFPASVVEHISENVSHALKEAIEKNEQQLREVNEKTNAKQLTALVDMVVWNLQHYQYNLADRTRGEIRTLIRASAERFQNDIASGNFLAVVENIPTHWSDWMYYSTALSYKETYWHGLRSREMHLYDEKCINTCRVLLKSFITAVSNVVGKMQKISSDIEQFSRLLKDNIKLVCGLLKYTKGGKKEVEFVQDLSEENKSLLPAIVSIVAIAKNHFVNLNKLFSSQLAEKDVAGLRQTLSGSKALKGCRPTLLSYLSDPSQCHNDHIRFAEEMSACLEHEEMVKELSAEAKRWGETLSSFFLENTHLTSGDVGDRTSFYSKVNASYKVVQKLSDLAEHLDTSVIDYKLTEGELFETVKTQVTNMAQHTVEKLKDVPASESATRDVHIYFENLIDFQDVIEDLNLKQYAKVQVKKIITQMETKLTQLREEAWNKRREKDQKTLMKNILLIKKISIDVPSFGSLCTHCLSVLLEDVRREDDGSKTIALLAARLNDASLPEGDKPIAQRIISEHDSFKQYALILRNEKTSRIKGEEVLEQLDGTQLCKDRLQELLYLHNKTFWSIVEKGIHTPEEARKDITQSVPGIVPKRLSDYEKLVNLIAHIFAFWTLSNAGEYVHGAAVETSEDNADEETAEDRFEEAKAEMKPKVEARKEDRNSLLQPHDAQIISIFRLLGLDAEVVEKQLANHLIEISTGEGKSATLAVASTVLALMGFQVDVASYSKYLSHRDQSDFLHVFNAFDVTSSISYGTFNELCETYIRRDGDVRKLVQEWVCTGTVSSESHGASSHNNMRILLIDEVDVFFNEDFYGSSYNPVVVLQDPAVTKLIHHVWTSWTCGQGLSLRDILSSVEYQACLQRFPRFQVLLEEHVKQLLYDVRTFESHNYIIHEGKIVYKEQDGISDKVSYGYKTMFAAFKETEAKRVLEDERNRRTGLLIRCGAFSFAEIPKKYYSIMGLTGTLRTLSKPEWKLLREVYGIQKETYMPSVYGRSKLIFPSESPDGVKIVPEKDYFRKITDEIKDRIVGATSVKRAVIVFFDSKETLRAYYASPHFREYKHRALILTEETKTTEKEGIVARAVSIGAISLMTREFGRGTDFKCFDDRLIAAGGVHVVQAFVSDALSEETQIKGRAARQGDKGSYSMVLKEETLERYGIKHNDVEEMDKKGKYYTVLHEKRQKFFMEQYPEKMRHVDDIHSMHEAAVQFQKALTSGFGNTAYEWLLKFNALACNIETRPKRTIVLMDATGSMCNLLTKAKNTVQTMFDRVTAIIRDKKVSDGFELQYVAYRNYDCPRELLLQHSAWETDANNIRSFLDTITAQNGYGANEAMEIGFWYVNKLREATEIDQVIVIGDAPPNTRQEVPQKRTLRGEHYWSATEFAKPTYYENELVSLCDSAVPVHAFYVSSGSDYARPGFEHVASITGGKTGKLDIDSDKGATVLTEIVATSVLNNVGGSRGPELVEEYYRRFGRSYMS